MGIGLPQVVADEWLLESAIAWNTPTITTAPPWPGDANGILADTHDGTAGGTCVSMADNPFTAGNTALDVRQEWYGGHVNTSVYGSQQHLADPATVASAVGVVWP